MKIRFLLHDVHGPGGGVVTVTLGLAEELAHRHDVELVSLVRHRVDPVHRLPVGVPVTTLQAGQQERARPTARLRRSATRKPSRIIPVGEPRYAQYNRYTDFLLVRYLRSVRGGAVVTMQPGLNIASARMGSRDCLRVAQDHRPFRTRPRSILQEYRRHAGGLDAFLALTEADAADFEELIGDQVTVRAMPNGTPSYTGPLSEHTNKTAIAAGRLARSKGFDVLISAWVEVARQHPDWRLQIWGEGGLRGELTRQIAGLGLQDRVHLMGFSTGLQEEMSRASVFVLSSRAEGYPRVILEAMACGLPVVSTDCPSGPREMIRPGVDGLLAPSENPEALAAAISQMIERGPDGRRSMGMAGLAAARERSQRVVAQRWEDLLSGLAERRGLAVG